MRMAGQRRFARFLSILFLAAGTSLLLYVGVSLLLSRQEPDLFEHEPLAGPSLLDLPPALAPAPQSLTQIEPPLPPSSGSNDAPLLPESPLPRAEMEETADPANTAAAAPDAAGSGPQRIIIPALGVDAPIYAAGLETKEDGQRTFQQWSVPDAYAAGWHIASAPLGQAGNTVLNGHNNVHGAVFGELASLAVGEQIILAGGDGLVVYRVAHHELVEEHGASLRERLRNARWIAPTADERLTLVTCWPNTSNSHRLIVVAEPDHETAEAALPLLSKRRTTHDS